MEFFGSETKLNSSWRSEAGRLLGLFFSAQLGATYHGSLLPLSRRQGIPDLCIGKNLIWCMLRSNKTMFKI